MPTMTRVWGDDREKPTGWGWRSHTLFILSTVAVGLFTDLFLYGLIIPLLPFMLEDRMGIPSTQTQTYTSVMLAAFAGSTVAFSPLAGVLADKMASRKAPFLLGLFCLILATLSFFLGNTIAILLAARVLQGISCAFVWAIGLAIYIETVGPENLGQTVGTIFSAIAIGTLWAPFLGRLLYEKFSLSDKNLAHESTAESSTDNIQTNVGPDHVNQEERGEEQPLLSEANHNEEFKLSRIQPRIAQAVPILPCLKHPALLTALLISLVQAIVMGSFDATVATVSRDLFDFDSFQAGMLFLPLGIMNLLCGPIVGWVVDRYGTKVVAVFSFGILVPAMVLLRLPQKGGLPQVVLYAGLLALAGIGVAGSGTASIVEAGAVVDKYYKANQEFFGNRAPYAMMYGINGMVFNLGLTLGPELAGELKEAIGYGNMNLVLSAISAFTAWLCFLYTGNKPK